MFAVVCARILLLHLNGALIVIIRKSGVFKISAGMQPESPFTESRVRETSRLKADRYSVNLLRIFPQGNSVSI